jgi:hypothetical protein
MIADRRITSDGVLVDDEYNKVCVFFCDDAKLGVAFTGLARFQTFDTSTWLAETLSDIGSTVLDIASVLAELQSRLEHTFGTFTAIRPEVTILLCGYVYGEGEPESRVYVLSNMYDALSSAAKFTLDIYATSEPKVIVAGMSLALPADVEAALHQLLLEPRLSRQSLLHFAIRRLRAAARDGRSGRLIGEQFNAVVMQAPVDTVVTNTYHAARGSYVAYGANVVVAQGIISLGARMDASSLLSGPEIRKRDPCWCGSGESFKHCHLKKYGAVYFRLPQFSSPLSMASNFELKQPRLSGSRFFVSSGFA